MSPRRRAGLPGPERHDLTERAFQAQLLTVAAMYGWRAYHTHDSRRSHPGFPDLVLVRPDPEPSGPQLVFAELKTSTGQVRPEQQAWIGDLQQVAAQAGGLLLAEVWRPAELEGRITRLLSRRPGGPPNPLPPPAA